MPFLGQDWRGPGCNWSKVDCSKWEEQEPSIGVLHDPIPRYSIMLIDDTILPFVLISEFCIGSLLGY